MGGIAGALIGGLIQVGLWAWMAVMNKKGRSWARIVATVFAVLGIIGVLNSLFQLPQLPGAALAVQAVLVLVQAVIVIGSLVLMWKKENNPYYAAMSAPRA